MRDFNISPNINTDKHDATLFDC